MLCGAPVNVAFSIELLLLLGCCAVNPCYNKVKRISNDLDLAAKKQYVTKCINVKLKKISLRRTLKETESPNVITYGIKNKKKTEMIFLLISFNTQKSLQIQEVSCYLFFYPLALLL